MKILKQSTATTVLLGPFVDETDGKTAETALTISQADVYLWKEGGTTVAAKSDATSATHRAIGYYTVPLDATDTGTLGLLTVAVHESGALPVRHDFFVVPAAVYDALKAGTGNGIRSDVQAIANDAITAAAIAADAIGASELAAGAATEIANAVAATVVESQGSYTVQQVLSICLAALAGVTGTSGSVIKTPNGSATRITATLNGSNERTAMTLAPSS